VNWFGRLHQPKPVAAPRSHEALAAGAQSLRTKVEQLSPAVATSDASPTMRRTGNFRGGGATFNGMTT
jgi:hypothetical protein